MFRKHLNTWWVSRTRAESGVLGQGARPRPGGGPGPPCPPTSWTPGTRGDACDGCPSDNSECHGSSPVPSLGPGAAGAKCQQMLRSWGDASHAWDSRPWERDWGPRAMQRAAAGATLALATATRSGGACQTPNLDAEEGHREGRGWGSPARRGVGEFSYMRRYRKRRKESFFFLKWRFYTKSTEPVSPRPGQLPPLAAAPSLSSSRVTWWPQVRPACLPSLAPCTHPALSAEAVAQPHSPPLRVIETALG